MAKKKEIKPESVEIVYQHGYTESGKQMTTVVNNAFTEALINKLLFEDGVQATVSTFKDKTVIDIIYQKPNRCGLLGTDPEPDGAIHIKVFPDIDRVTLTSVGKKLTFGDETTLGNAMPNATKTLFFKHYQKRKKQTYVAVFVAANDIRGLLNEIDTARDRIADRFQLIDHLIH